MKAKFAVIAGLLVVAAATFAEAQDNAPAPTVGVGSKTMESCSADIRKYCGNPVFNAETQKECLVTNWTSISSDCQDALAKPGRGLGGE